MDQPHKQRPTSKFILTGFTFPPVKAHKLAVVIIIVFATTLPAAALPRMVPGLRLAENWVSNFRFTVLTRPQSPDPNLHK